MNYDSKKRNTRFGFEMISKSTVLKTLGNVIEKNGNLIAYVKPTVGLCMFINGPNYGGYN